MMNAASISEALGGKPLSTGGFSAPCPAHEDTNPSLSIDDGKSGLLVHCHAGCEGHEVISKLRERNLWPTRFQHEPHEEHPQLGAYSSHWDYQDASGNLMMRVCRWDRPGGRKEIRPQTLQAEGWRWRNYEKDRPIYRLSEVVRGRQGRVLVVEGEKTAEAAAKIAPEMVVTTWSGGAKAIEKTSWEPLRGRDVTLLADNDAPGAVAMNRLAVLLSALGCKLRRVDLSTLGELPTGWDCADAFDDHNFNLQALWELIASAPMVDDAPAQSTPQEQPAPDPLAGIRARLLADIEAGPGAIDAALPPRFVSYPVMPVAGANLAGTGGTSKTTTVLNEKIQVANGHMLYGNEVDLAGLCVLITAEDGAKHGRYLLQRIIADGLACGALPERAADRAKNDIRIVGWQRDLYGPLVNIDREGGFHRANVFDLLLELMRQLGPVYVTLDPAVLFSAGERYGNDGDAFFASMLHEAALELGACVQLIDHVSQAVAREGIIDQHAARGGTAKTDNARLARQLVRIRPEDAAVKALPIAATDKDVADGNILQLHWTKSNYAPKPAPVWLRRRGYWIEDLRAPAAEERAAVVFQEREAELVGDVAAVVEFVRAQLALGIGVRYTQRDLDDQRPWLHDGSQMSRSRLRAAIVHAIATAQLSLRDLPKAERRGARKQYLAPAEVPQ